MLATTGAAGKATGEEMDWVLGRRPDEAPRARPRTRHALLMSRVYLGTNFLYGLLRQPEDDPDPDFQAWRPW